MADDNEANTMDSTGIVKPLSAYHHYSRHNSSLVKEELIKEGKDTALGVIVSVVAARFKTLTPEERAKYDKMAAEDKERYEIDCAIRDEEVLLMQEEKRKANALTETSSRMRGSTMKMTDESTALANVEKRTVVFSEEVLAERAAAKADKKAREDATKAQMAELKKHRAQQAEARLKFLLSQSDIFSHFGAVKADKMVDEAGGASNSSSSGASSKKLTKRSSASGMDELDDDERAMAEDEIDDNADDNSSSSSSSSSSAAAGSGKGGKKNTVLLKQPSIITGGEMRSYQLEGLNWMIRLEENGLNGILADEMGLGKTLQSISILAYMREYRHIHGPHIVMVPKSTLSNWCNEFKRWCPEIRTLRFHGTKDMREELIKEHLRPGIDDSSREWDVLITTYEIVNLEKGALSKIAWKYIIIDEAHRLKNEATTFAATVRAMSSSQRLLITGTPLQNNLHELWALLNFLLPDVFESADQFDDWFNLDVDDTEAKQRMISQLHKLLRPFMLRRLKLEVEKSLPPKTETILFTGMSAVQKNLYKQILLRDIDTINSSSTAKSESSRTAILNIVMQLRKCCNHPYLFPSIEDRSLNPMGSHLYENCGKMVLLDKLLTRMKALGHRVLIFSQMTRMIDILEDYFISKEYGYCRIDGNTTYEEREDRIYDYNRPDSDKFIFVLSTRAGGLGINLQTADTVILYDSDWNPQADLQAQDRAHRIGQKKPVQVFRLVTEDTVEVKVVERAQQKLKLDAMVVQQGRLADKDKKMSKDDLLDTLRFGADKIFRSKDSSISDADIDLILEQGRKKTEEMSSKMAVNEKGDMYDFRLDGGLSTQIFEGVDYSEAKTREEEKNALAGLAFIDPGKRERKAIATYSETIARQEGATDDRRRQLPRHLRLPKMDDWQFFAKTRLGELQAEEVKLFDEMQDRGELNTGSTKISELVILPPEKHEEKMRLLQEGFGEWTKVHFNNFVRASAKHGRNEYEKISKDVGRSVEDTKRYCLTFWERGATDLPANEFDRVTKQIEKGEKRLEEISRLTNATAKLIMMFADPWEDLTFRNVGNQGRIFNAVEDRFLLCLTHLHGYGNWELIRNSVRRCERFRFDFYLQSCSAEALGKRCEALMRTAERELTEIERKRAGASEAPAAAAAAAAKEVGKAKLIAGEALKDRVSEISQQIADEAKKLAATRAQLAKVKAAGGTSGSIKNFMEKTVAKSAGTEDRVPLRGVTSAGVPNALLPELCKTVKAAGPDGIQKVIDKFAGTYPTISRRQTEIKIQEIAVKEKRGGDKVIMWHILPEFEKYLHMDSLDTAAGLQAITAAFEENNARKKAALQLAASDKSSAGSVATAAAAAAVSAAAASASSKKSISNKSKSSSSSSSSSSAPSSGVKRKNTDNGSATTTPAAKSAKKAPSTSASTGSGFSSPSPTKGPTAAAGASSSSLVPPAKYKRAFGFFVKAKRAEAEGALGDKASNSEALKDLLTKMWAEVSADVRKAFEKKETEDKARYDSELMAYEAAKKSSKKNGTSAESGTSKKAKH